jgi:hypothetical protein
VIDLPRNGGLAFLRMIGWMLFNYRLMEKNWAVVRWLDGRACKTTPELSPQASGPYPG